MTFFCGQCGSECHLVVKRRRFLDEAYGAPKMFAETDVFSDCCGSEYLYTDADLSIEATELEIEDAVGMIV